VYFYGKIPRSRSPVTQRENMYALQRPQCDPRNQLPQVWLPEPAPKEQGKKGVIFFPQYFFFRFYPVLSRFKKI
jgi:hypothetical protein